MAESCTRAAWNHTANLMALIANCHREKGKRALTAADFDPFGQKSQWSELPKADVSILKDVFIDRNFPEGVLKPCQNDLQG